MAANARDGFWNGARPPLGYQTIIFERRRDRAKKKLAIDDSEAPLVRKIFDLYLSGDGEAGPMGVKKIASWLNARGYSYRGKRSAERRVGKEVVSTCRARGSPSHEKIRIITTRY